MPRGTKVKSAILQLRVVQTNEAIAAEKWLQVERKLQSLCDISHDTSFADLAQKEEEQAALFVQSEDLLIKWQMAKEKTSIIEKRLMQERLHEHFQNSRIAVYDVFRNDG